MIDDFAGHFARHALLAASGLGGGAVLGTIAGYCAFTVARIRTLVTGMLVFARTVPSLAVLMLAVPFFGIGIRPAIIALIFLAAVPIAVAVEASLRGVAPATIEAARALGLSENAVQRRVRIPLALPHAISGVRTAAVETIAGASLAAFIGGGGFGDYIVEGLAVGDSGQLAVGAAAIAAFALVSEGLLSAVQRRLFAAQRV